ncbi:MAG: hypothetical protein LQ350_003911 [Teloschistes chrysophthalmus]|nr:MAG: hypothetical protein LQ350_003911 [Niorma chrysophthalma]
MPAAKITQNPSPYNAFSFHLIRLAQFISATIVTSVVAFFTHYLLVEHYHLPWTFIFLLAASFVTIVTLLASSALYHFRTLSPRHNLILNTALSCLWILGLSFLTWNLGWTLGHRCLLTTWHNDSGIMVCRLYKACTAFTVTGLLSTLLALTLDIRTHRHTTHLGTYNRMNEPLLDLKRPTTYPTTTPIISSPSPSPSPYPTTTPQYPPYSSPRADNSMMTTGDLGEYRVREEFEVQQFREKGGYEAPSEQTRYDPGREGRF